MAAPIWLELIDKERSERTGRLDLGRTGLNYLPEELQEMEWVEELILGNDNTAYPGYETNTTTKNNGLPNDLGLSGLTIPRFPKLRLLALHDLKLGSFPILPGLSKLEVLDLDGNGISQIDKQIGSLTALRELYLGRNAISKIENLQGLQNLQKLHLNLNQLTEIESLATLEKLTELVLVGNQVNRASRFPLALRILDLGDNKINTDHLSRIFLSQLHDLQELRLAFNDINNIEKLGKLVQLKKLDLSHNRITETGNLHTEFENLETLDLSYNQVTTLRAFNGLKELKQLNLRQNKITQLRGLNDLPKIERLDLSQVGSSRVDLQACKLEYSIVSPK